MTVGEITTYATATTAFSHNLQIGDIVNIQGMDMPFVATGSGATSSSTTVTFATSGLPTGVPASGAYLYIISATGVSTGIYSISAVSATTVTATGLSGTGSAIVWAILYSGANISYYGGLRQVTSVPTATTFTYSIPSLGSFSATVSGNLVPTGSVTFTGGNLGQGYYTGTGLIQTSQSSGQQGWTTSNITSSALPVSAGGSGYNVGDILCVGSIAQGGLVKVLTVSSGAVSTVGIISSGSGYSATLYNTINMGNLAGGGIGGSGCTITPVSANLGTMYSVTGGGGQGALVAVTATSAPTTWAVSTTYILGQVVVPVVSNGHYYKCTTAGTSAGSGTPNWPVNGQSLTDNAATWYDIGTTTPPNFISTASVISGGVNYTNGAQTFTLAPAAAPNTLFLTAQATTLLVDLSKNWNPNELVGKIVVTALPAVGANATQMTRIIANNSYSMTFSLAITAVTNGLTKYVIHDPKPFGTECTNKYQPNQYSWGIATGGTTTALNDAAGGLYLPAPNVETNTPSSIIITNGGSGYALSPTNTLTLTAPNSYATWVASTSYAVGKIVVPTAPNSHYYICTSAGVSSGSQPTWPTTGGTVVDGTAVWQDTGIPSGGTLTVTSLNGTVVTGVAIANIGSGYYSGITYATTVSPTNGTGCTITVNSTTTKNWIPNQWVGKKVKVLAGTGVNAFPNEIYISANTASQLQMSGIGKVSLATAGSSYAADNVLTLTTPVNTTWAGSTGYTTTGGPGSTPQVVVPTSANGHYYQCTVSGTSAATASQPMWPTNGGTVVDNTATWQDIGTAPFGGTVTTNASTLTSNSITVNAFGTGYVAGIPYAVTGGGGSGAQITVVATQSLGFTPDATTVYSIMDNWGVGTSNGIATFDIGAGGVGYSIGDVLAVGTGVGGYVRVLNTNAGAVTQLQLVNPGSAYTVSTPATTNLTGIGVSCTVKVLSITTANAATTIIDPYQNWGGNQTAATSILPNKNVRLVCGGTTRFPGKEVAISTNNGTTLTIATITNANSADGTAMYAILGVTARGVLAGSSFIRLFGTTVWDRARYCISWKGNATSQIDRYDMQQDVWDFLAYSPLTDTFTTGSSFDYNGKDRIYFTRNLTGYVYAYDFSLNKIIPCGMIPYVQGGTGYQGNRLFTMSQTDMWNAGLEYVYLPRVNGTEMWRELVFW